MKVSGEKLNFVLNKVRVIREHLKTCPHPQEPTVNPDDIRWAIQDLYALEIDIVEVTFTAEHLAGNIERFDNKRARILVRSGQTAPMKRFVATKELSHLAIDEQDDWSTLGVETIKNLLSEYQLLEKNGEGHQNPARSLASEILAEIAAIELLYSFEYREADIKKIEADETTINKIALEHDVPPFAIETALVHYDVLKQIWDEINKA